MRSVTLKFALATTLCAAGPWAAAQSLPLAPNAAPGVHVAVVARGLHDPRGLALAPEGVLYVAEAGTTQSAFLTAPPPEPGPRTRDRCFVSFPVGPATPGFSARISKVAPSGQVTTVAADLPSMASNALIGGDRMGVSAVSFTGGRLYAVSTGAGCSRGHSEDNALLRVYGNGATAPIADLSNALRGHPDSKDPAADDFEPDGTWYSLLHAFGGFYTVEPNHGVFIRIGHDGTVTRLADLIASVAAIDAQHDGDRTFTALALHRGDFYVGTLGRIDTGFAASVYRVSRDGRRVAEVASGFHGVVGIAFDRQDRMLVLETTDSSFPPLSNPAAGRLLRVERNGSLTPLVTNLTFPSALIAGREGEFYVSVCGFHCDRPLTGPGPRVSLESGQVLRVDVDRHPSWRDDDED